MTPTGAPDFLHEVVVPDATKMKAFKNESKTDELGQLRKLYQGLFQKMEMKILIVDTCSVNKQLRSYDTFRNCSLIFLVLCMSKEQSTVIFKTTFNFGVMV